jgi:hypothetical protein
MNKNDLEKTIVETAYNVGFGAKVHFATYDIIAKIPELVGFLSFAIGVFALFVESLPVKVMSATFIVLGVASLHITQYDHNKEKYEQAGIELTKLYNRLKALYMNVRSNEGAELREQEKELECIEKEYYEKCISNQVLLSNWYAHYKFFWQHQIDWMSEQKKFRLFQDKIPLSFVVTVVCIAFFGAFLTLAQMDAVVDALCNGVEQGASPNVTPSRR